MKAEMNKERWHRLLDSLQLVDKDDTYQKLALAHAEKHRAYHTTAHINACLQHADNCAAQFAQAEAVELAIWFHDAIYKPFSSSNEADSAKWAVDFLESSDASHLLKSTVFNLILATKHEGATTTQDESLLVDLDLAILGAEAAVYDQYEVDIRFEYKYVPKYIFCKKRSSLLTAFLDRKAIYTNEYFHSRFESNARMNLTNAIARLTDL